MKLARAAPNYLEAERNTSQGEKPKRSRLGCDDDDDDANGHAMEMNKEVTGAEAEAVSSLRGGDEE